MQLDVLLLADLGLRTVGRGRTSANTRRVKVMEAQAIITEEKLLARKANPCIMAQGMA